MTIYYQLSSIPKIDLRLVRGDSFRKKWDLTYCSTPFPFFDEQQVPLWTATLEIREEVEDLNPAFTFSSATDEVFMVTELVEQVEVSSYGILLTGAQTVTFPLGRSFYLIRFNRIADDWLFKIQNGNFEVVP